MWFEGDEGRWRRTKVAEMEKVEELERYEDI